MVDAHTKFVRSICNLQCAVFNTSMMLILNFEHILAVYLGPCAINLWQSALNMGYFAMMQIRCLVRLGLTCSSHPWFQSLPQASHLLANECPQCFFWKNASLDIHHAYTGTSTSIGKKWSGTLYSLLWIYPYLGCHGITSSNLAIHPAKPWVSTRSVHFGIPYDPIFGPGMSRLATVDSQRVGILKSMLVRQG